MARAPVAWVAVLVVAGCPAPSDVTPIIHVDPRAAQRLAWFGGRVPVEEPAAALAPQSPAAAQAMKEPARVHAMKEGEPLGGPGATGRPGDWVLENAEVVFVVGQVGGDAGPTEGAGNVIDAADARVRKDDLGHVVPAFGATPPESVYTSLRSGTDADGSAWIEVSGRGTSQATPQSSSGAAAPLALTTRYTLHAPDRALLLETTLENTGEAPIDLAAVGDAVEWGAAEKVAPGAARGFVGPSSGAYIGAVGVDASYALTSTDGSIEAVSGTSWTRTVQRKKVSLAAHERTAVARVLIVGARADTTSLVGELALVAGLPVGELEVTVPGAAAGTTLLLTPQGSTQALTLVRPFEAMLPEGRYWLTWASVADGGQPPSGPLALDVKAGRVAKATVDTAGAPGLSAP
jgi:hypothetical protein